LAVSGLSESKGQVWSTGVVLRLTPRRVESTAQAIAAVPVVGITACCLGGKITAGAVRILTRVYQPPLIIEEYLHFSLRCCETLDVLHDRMSITRAVVGEKNSSTQVRYVCNRCHTNSSRQIRRFQEPVFNS
jgi:hypothetical protein